MNLLNNQQHHPCPCCGYLTFKKPAGPGTYQICPVCFWEDAYSFYEEGTNSVSLQEAQQNFLELGACSPEYIDDVRPSTENEPRLENWQTLTEKFESVKGETITAIKKAFEKVELEDGITLIEGRLRDDYMMGEKEKEKSKRIAEQIIHENFIADWYPDIWQEMTTRTYVTWQNIPDKLIEKLHDVLCFLDEKGYRFYLPAYMIYTINNFNSSHSNAIDSTIFSLIPSEYNLSRFQSFNQWQSQAICQFLSFIALFYTDGDAIKALEYWGKFCQLQPGEVYYQYYCSDAFYIYLSKEINCY